MVPEAGGQGKASEMALVKAAATAAATAKRDSGGTSLYDLARAFGVG